MNASNEFVRKAYYSQELKHQICKDHIENGLRLSDCVKKYNLSGHSLVHDWLRQLGYIAGVDRRRKTVYIGIENFKSLPNKQKNKVPLTQEQHQIQQLKKELEDAKLQAEGYRRMIEIAESELKISIRKKPNTK